MELIDKDDAIHRAWEGWDIDEAAQNIRDECEPFLILPDNLTNGEVIRALFPKAKIFENESNIEYQYVDVFLYSENDMNCYKKEWWNSPYQKGGE